MNDVNGSGDRHFLSNNADVSWKDYVDTELDNLKEYAEKLVESAKELSTKDTATLQAIISRNEEQLVLKFISVNEFRGTLSDQATHFVTNDSLNSIEKGIKGITERNRDDITKINIEMANLAGKADQKSVNVAYIFTAVSVILSIVSLIVKFAE